MSTPQFPLQNASRVLPSFAREIERPLENRQWNEIGERSGLPVPIHPFTPLRGQVHRFSFTSELLTNHIGDPIEREVLVHLSSEAINAQRNGEALPVIIYLAAYTSSGLKMANWRAFDESILQRHERLVAEGKMKPCILVLPDCFTSFGGNQFVDSPVIGRWSSWLQESLKKEIDDRYHTNGNFGLVGKSSGGYGVLYQAINHSDQWDAFASHSGDVGFDTMFADWASTATHLQQYADVNAFLTSLAEQNSLRQDQFHALMICGLAAMFDPQPITESTPFGLTLPIDLNTCELNDERWNQWLAFDPIHLVKNLKAKPSELHHLYIDCGAMDQYHIQYGTRRLCALLSEVGISYEYHEFEGTHSGIDHRLDVSLPWLSHRLSDR